MSYYNAFAGHLRGVGRTPYANSFSLDYPGVNQYMNFANPSNFRFVSGGVDQPFSGGGWVKMDDATRFYFLIKQSSTVLEWRFLWDASDFLIIALYQDNSTKFIQSKLNAASTADEGSWVHFAFTYDGSGTAAGLNIYRNGVAPAQTRSTGAGGYTFMQDSGANLEIGRTVAGFYSNGKVADSAVWDSELSAAQMLAVGSVSPFDLRTHSAAGNIVLFSNIKNQSPTQPDLSGNGNDGTMQNSPTVSIDHP